MHAQRRSAQLLKEKAAVLREGELRAIELNPDDPYAQAATGERF